MATAVDSVLSAEYVSFPKVFLADVILTEGIEPTDEIGAHVVLLENQNVEPVSIDSTVEMGAASVFAPIDQVMTIPSAVDESAVGNVVVSYDQEGTPSSIGSGASVSEPWIWCDDDVIEVGVRAIGSREAVNDITVVIDNQNIEPIGIENSEWFGNTSVNLILAVAAEITPDSIDSAESVSNTAAVKVEQSVTVVGIDSSEAVAEPRAYRNPTTITMAANSVLTVIALNQQFNKPQSVYEIAAAIGDIEVGGFCYMEVDALTPGGDFFVEGE